MTGKNAAGYLMDYFDSGNATDAESMGYEFADIVAALKEVNEFVDLLEEIGEDTELMRDCMKRINKSALEPFSVNKLGLNWSYTSFTRPDRDLNPGDLMALQIIEKKMQESSLHFTVEQRKRISSLIDETKKALGDVSGDLPTGLALYLRRLINETETALQEYDITGDFVLEKAYSRLREALDIAIEKTSKQKNEKWQKAKGILRELAIGFIVEASGQVLSAAQVFPQIGA